MSEQFQFFDGYEEYIMNYLTETENESDNALDVVTNKDTNFLFINSNNI